MQNKQAGGHIMCFSYIRYALFLQMIKMGSDVETVLRESVLQMEHIGEEKLCMLFVLPHRQRSVCK